MEFEALQETHHRLWLLRQDKSIAKCCEKTQFLERKSFAVNRYGMANSRMLAEEVLRLGDSIVGAWVDAGSPAP